MKKNKILSIVIFIVLLVLMAYLPVSVIKLFKLDTNSFSKNMLILYNFICDLGYMIIIFFVYRKDIIRDLKDLKNNFNKIFGLAFKYYFVGLMLMFLSNFLIALFFSGANANNEETIREYINLYPLYMLFSVSIYAPFVEEILFRKAIYNCIIPYKQNMFTKYLYIILSGLIFASLHVVGLGDKLIDYVYVVPYLSLGIAFALIYYKSKNIFSTIMMHCLHNTVTILLYILVGVN